MHLQVRCVPRSSPPDVEPPLRILKEAGLSLRGIGGSNVEFGGELALAPKHDDVQAVMDALAAYHPRVVDAEDPDSGLTFCAVEDRAGGLHDCLVEAASVNLKKGRIIRDILVGVPDDEEKQRGVVPIQIYSEVVRSEASLRGAAPD
jgi:hypothetical protein